MVVIPLHFFQQLQSLKFLFFGIIRHQSFLIFEKEDFIIGNSNLSIIHVFPLQMVHNLKLVHRLSDLFLNLKDLMLHAGPLGVVLVFDNTVIQVP